MKLTLEKHPDCARKGEVLVATLVIGYDELTKANLRAFDQAVIRDCENAPTISAKLLALEIVARRIEESENAKNANAGVRPSPDSAG